MAVEQEIREFTHSGGVRLGVDRESGVIRGVKLLGLESTNGRTYLKEAVARAAGLYEGAKVNVDHQTGKTDGPRSYGDRIGLIENVRLDQGDGGLRGDLRANPKHRLFEQLAWDAEHSPNSVGFSHDIVGKTTSRGGRTVVEEITRVSSVDLVADPATTRGLFEQVGDGEEAIDMAQETLTVASLRTDYPGLVDEIIREDRKAQANGEEATNLRERCDHLEAENKTLRETVDKYEATAALDQKRQEIDAAIKEAKLPAELVTDVFRGQLMEAEDSKAVKALIEDRLSVAKPTRQAPTSKEQIQEGDGHTQMSREDFLTRLKKPREVLNV
ncbi:MAG: hypothetical protein ACYSWU_23565 [Planctomycetota bacterium]